MADHPELRISDADRQAVVDQLRRHTGDGRLTLDEFSERVEIVFAARTSSELEPALSQLPTLSSAVPTDVTEKEKRYRIVAFFSGNDRKGRWKVRRRTTAFACMGGVTLDLRRATLEGDDIEIRCWAIMGGVDVLVPEGIPVDFDGFLLMGGRTERIADVPPIPGAPTIRIRGYGMWGGVTVKSMRPGQKTIGEHIESFVHDAIHPPAELTGSRSGDSEIPLMPSASPASRVRSVLSSLPTPPTPPIPAPPIPPFAFAPAAHAAEPGTTAVTTGTMSIVVTDIVGSTAHAERLGDQRWLSVLQAHNALVREQLTRYGGTEVKQSGDGFLATFSSARGAVRASIGINRAIASYSAGHPDTPIELRIGVHAGEVEREDHDVFGVNVSTAARIAALAGPGEVLVSGVVRDLAESTSDLSFGEPREVLVAGRSAPIRVHAALGD